MKLNHLMALPLDTESETVATGFQHLDHLTGGLRTGQLWTVSARPGEGKTAFAVSLLRNIGVIQKVPTAYLSLESNRSEIMRRLKASLTGSWETVPAPSVEMMDVMNMIGLHYRDIEQEAIQLIEDAPILIEYDSEASVDVIVSRMEKLRQEKHVRVVIIDSVSLLMCGRTHIEQTQVIKKLYQTAGKLKIVVILTAGLDPLEEMREGCCRPQLTDLRGMGQIEVFSSMVMFVYRLDYYCFEIFEDDCDSCDFEMSENGTTHLYRICDTFEDGTSAIDMADIMVEKNNFGGTGNVRMRFDNHAGFKEALFEKDDENYMFEPSDTGLSVSQPLFTLSNFTV